MIQQSIAQFTRNAQKATSIVDDKLPDRQRGMWSFLTWSFFLAQAVAVHEAFAKGHASGDAGADADGPGFSNGDDAAQKGISSASMLGVSGFEVDPAAAAQFAAAIAAGIVTPQMLAGFQAEPALFQAFVDQLTGNASAVAADMTAAAAEELAAAVHGEGDGGSHEGPIPGIDLHGINLPGGITLPIDVAIDLGLELGSDLGLGLGLHVGGPDDISLNLNVAPILGLNFGLDGDGLSLSALGMNLLSANSDGPFDSLLSGPFETLSGITGPAYDALSGPLGGLASGAQDLTWNVTGGLVPITAPVTALFGDVLGHGSDSGLLASGGTILQTPGSFLPVHDLFANGEHTDYGIELQSSQPKDSALGESLVASLSANVETLDVAALADDALKSILHGISGDYHG